MKKFYCVFLYLISALLFQAAQAQTEKSARLAGGDGYLLIRDGFSASLNPQYGVFVADNLALGGGLGLDYNRNNTGVFTNFSRITLSPFLRYYLGTARTRPFTEGSFGYELNIFDDADDAYSNTHYSLGLGVTRFIAESVGLEAQAAYSSATTRPFENRQSGLVLRFGFQIFLQRAANSGSDE